MQHKKYLILSLNYFRFSGPHSDPPSCPYVCRTGNITLRCTTSGAVSWTIDDMANVDPSTIPGHTALPHTTTYQEVVVDNYTNLATGYVCIPTLSDGSQIQSNSYIPQIECECHQATITTYLLNIDGHT